MLGPNYVEHIHDDLVVKLWPGAELVGSQEYRNRGLIESAVHRPFQSAFGQDIHPTILDKAIALFHSLADHAFYNGNKRTAVIGLQHFLLANGFLLVLSNDFLYKLAKRTASHRERGLSTEESLQEIADAVKPNVIDLEDLKRPPSLWPVKRRSGSGFALIQVHHLLPTFFSDAMERESRKIRRDKRNRLIPAE